MCSQSRCCHGMGETKGIIPPGSLEGGMQPSWSGRAQGQETLVRVSREERERCRKRQFAGRTENRGLVPDGLDLTVKAGGKAAHGDGERAGAQGEEGSEAGWGEGQRARSPHEVRACSAQEVRPGAQATQRPRAGRGRIGPRWAGRQGRGEGYRGPSAR